MKKAFLAGSLLPLALYACGEAEQKAAQKAPQTVAASQASIPSPASCADASRAGRSVRIKGGRSHQGDTRFHPDEGPEITVDLKPFDIDAYEVTNAEFSAFVAATGYVTRAERGLPEPAYDKWPDEMRAPGSAVFSPPLNTPPQRALSWWKFVKGANWRAPTGPGSSIEGKETYPVVHIAYEDAVAYAEWRGRRLPSEAEWEAAARAGVEGAPYAWGEAPPDELDQPAANTWQGIFPYVNQETDGYAGLAPVGCYAANAYGLYDMIGNVWEWTSDRYAPRRSETAAAIDDKEDGAMPMAALGNPASGGPAGVLKGGSYLCANNYCMRFRPAARQMQDLTLGASHIGFRTAADIKE